MKEILCFLFDVHFDVFSYFHFHIFRLTHLWSIFFMKTSENQAIFVSDMGDVPKAQYSH